MTTNASTTRREWLGIAAGVVAAAATGLLAARRGVLDAQRMLADHSATVTAPAVRTASSKMLTFRVLPGDGLIVSENFGGRSVSREACSPRGIDIFPTTETTRGLVACVDGVIEGQRTHSGSQGNSRILQDALGVSYRSRCPCSRCRSTASASVGPPVAPDSLTVASCARLGEPTECVELMSFASRDRHRLQSSRRRVGPMTPQRRQIRTAVRHETS